jgi:PAS domain S-box-containing protein
LFTAPSAWVLFVVVFAAVAWLGRDTALGIAMACAVAAAIAWSVSSSANLRRRAVELEGKARSLRDGEQRAQGLLARLPGVVWQCNAASERVFISDVWSRLTGQPAERATGKGWAACIHSDDRQRRRSAHKIAAAKAEPYEIEFRLKAANGGFRTVVDCAAPILDEKGQLLGYAGFTIDASMRKRVESDLRQRVEDLAQDNEALQAQALDLAARLEVQKAGQREHERDASQRGEFLAALSDELRGPVQIVRDTTALLRASDLVETQLQQLETLNRAAGELSLLMGRALELSFIAAESEPDGEGRCDLREAVEQAVTAVREKTGDQDVELEALVDHSLPRSVNADEAALRCAIEEMAASALKIPGPEKLSLHADFGVQSSGGSALSVTITVDARSAPDGVIDRAFYPSEATTGATPGLGLGLCRRRVEQMGGNIGVNCEDDGRIVFWFTIPLVDLGSGGDPRRAYPRVTQESVTCSHGPVIDLSVSGMRIRCRRPPEGVFDVELADGEAALELRAEVVWAEKIGFRLHEVGLRFIDLEPQTASQLGALAARNRMRRVMGAA